MRVAHLVQPLVVELELVEDRVVDPHFLLGGQPEVDLELVERGLKACLRGQERGLGLLVLLRDWSRSRTDRKPALSSSS